MNKKSFLLVGVLVVGTGVVISEIDKKRDAQASGAFSEEAIVDKIANRYMKTFDMNRLLGEADEVQSLIKDTDAIGQAKAKAYQQTMIGLKTEYEDLQKKETLMDKTKYQEATAHIQVKVSSAESGYKSDMEALQRDAMEKRMECQDGFCKYIEEFRKEKGFQQLRMRTPFDSVTSDLDTTDEMVAFVNKKWSAKAGTGKAAKAA